MIERVVDFSVKNRFLVILLVLVVAALGVRAAQRLPIDAVPDVTNVQVQVLTNAPALGPLEVEQLITFPVESVMSGLPHLTEVRSVSRFGLSAVTIVFEEGTDIYFARQLVSERLSAVRDAIPAEYGRPELGPISSGLGEIYQFEVRGDPMCAGADTEECFTRMELRSLLDWYIAYHLRSVPGVVEVNAFGGELKTYEVRPDPARLRALGLGIDDLLRALEENNLSGGGGSITHAGEQRLIRADGLLTGLADIRRVVVATRSEGTPIRIQDVAEVVNAPMIRQGAVTRDGRGEVVTATVMMLTGENSRDVARRVDERIEAIRPTLPDGVTIETLYDRTDLVDRTIATAATNLVEGGAFVVVVLLLLLGNVRGSLLVTSVIPLSMLAAIIAMDYAGLSGNLMSLGSIDFGIIVDGAVVIVEQIVSALHHRDRARVDGTVRTATRAVARPVLFGVGIIMMVYVPILGLEGIEGKMFRPMALTVLFALGAAALLAVTFVPAVATLVLRGPVRDRETALLRLIRSAYEPMLDHTLRRPWLPVSIAAGVLVVAAALATTLGAVFVPRLDEGAIAIQAVRLPSVSLEESVRATTRVEDVIRTRFGDEVETVVSRTGRAEVATDPMGVELSDIYLMLRPRGPWSRTDGERALVDRIEEALEEEVPGQNYLFSQPIELRTNELISGVRSDVAIHVYGEDLDELRRISEEMVRVLRTIEGAADVQVEQLAGLPFLDVAVDRDALARYGIPARAVIELVRTLGGLVVGQVIEGQRRFALQVRLPVELRDDVDKVRDLPLSRPGGGTVPLGQVARIERTEGPATISREAVQRRMTLQVNVRDRDLSAFVADARARLAEEVEMPPGYLTGWGGQFEHLEQATARLAILVPATLLLIFLLLFMAYGAARPALIIYLNVPFAATGGVFALLVRDMPFSISASIGFIALFGVAVLNGVVLVSTIRELQRDGRSLQSASRDGARMRLRPVLMTALAATLGFLPMAVSTSAGAEVQRPLATVVIGGLVTCTALTLLVLPAIYSRFGGAVERLEEAEA